MQATKCPAVQCHNYARGSCKISHSISVAKANRIVIAALERAVDNLQFNITTNKQNSKILIDYDKFIDNEMKKLDKIKEAYLNGIDTLEEYKENKKQITDTIEKLKAEKDEQPTQEINLEEYRQKTIDVLEYIKSPDHSEASKNEMLRTIIDKIVYNKENNSLDLFFY
jgi:hypothetical protein